MVDAADLLNARELERYVARVSECWRLEAALLGGARVADARGAGSQRERGDEWVVVLVSPDFEDVPWLERVHRAAMLWDRGVMGTSADLHCYTPVEFERKRETLPVVRCVVEEGIDLQAPLVGQMTPFGRLGRDDAPDFLTPV